MNVIMHARNGGQGYLLRIVPHSGPTPSSLSYHTFTNNFHIVVYGEWIPGKVLNVWHNDHLPNMAPFSFLETSNVSGIGREILQARLVLSTTHAGMGKTMNCAVVRPWEVVQQQTLHPLEDVQHL